MKKNSFSAYENFPREGLKRVIISKENIEGQLPSDLVGTLIRNGPGLNEVYGTKLKHPIDGDGLVATVTFDQECVTFQAKFVQTYSHQHESSEKKFLYPGQMGSYPPPSSPKINQWRDMAHTNAFYWGGRLLACHEYTFPNVMDPITLDTLGKGDNKGRVGEKMFGKDFEETRAVCAHYRIDQNLNQLIMVGFQPGTRKKPVLNIVEYDTKWNVVEKQSLHIPGLNYVHDILVTTNWYIVQMTPFVKISPELIRQVIKREASPGDQMRYYPDLPSRIVFIQRRQTGKHQQHQHSEPPKVIQVDDPVHGTHIFHFGYAWEKNPETVEFSACCLPDTFTMYDKTNQWIGNAEEGPGRMCCYRFEKGQLTRSTIDEIPMCEFPTLHPFRQVGTALRYTYVMASSNGKLPFTDILKIDRMNPKGRKIFSSPGYIVGEPLFAPKCVGITSRGGEDEGWVLVQRRAPDGESAFVILDAQTMQLECIVHLPCHLPMGFHGSWCPEVLRTTFGKM